MIDLFNTRTMLQAIEQIPRPKTFLLDTFFGGSVNFETAYVDIDIIKGKRRLAPFVHPTMPGKVLDRTGFTTRSYKPPYVKPKMPTKAADLLNRAAGQTIYANSETMAQRAARQLGMDLAEMDDTITRREEWMAAQALDAGTIRCIGEGVDDTLDFLMDANHKITLAGAALWSADTSDPISNLVDWARLIAKDSGLSATHAIFGISAWKAFFANAAVKSKYNMLKVQLGQILPQQLPNGVTYCGALNESGISVDLYTYAEWYVDDQDNTEKPLVPDKKVWLGAAAARNKRLYGAIQDMQAQGNFAVSRFPKSWLEDDPSIRWVMVQSAPVVALLQPDGFVSAQVLA